MSRGELVPVSWSVKLCRNNFTSPFSNPALITYVETVEETFILVRDARKLLSLPNPEKKECLKP
jgi:hypothetical protein